MISLWELSMELNMLPRKITALCVMTFLLPLMGCRNLSSEALEVKTTSSPTRSSIPTTVPPILSLTGTATPYAASENLPVLTSTSTVSLDDVSTPTVLPERQLNVECPEISRAHSF